MSNDIYKPPESNLDASKENNQPVKGSPVKAIAIATVVDIGGTLLASIIITIVYATMLAANGMSPEEIDSMIQNSDLLSTYSLISIFVGCLITVYAGYLCAKKVNYSEYRFVFIFTIIMLLLGIVISGSFYKPGEMFILSMLSMGSAFVGAWLYVRKKT